MLNMSSEYSYCSEGGFDEMSSSSDSGFDVSFESPKHELIADALGNFPAKDEKRKKTRNARCKSPTQVYNSSLSRSLSLSSRVLPSERDAYKHTCIHTHTGTKVKRASDVFT